VALTRTSIDLALVEYAAALWLMMSMGRGDWPARTPRGALARWLWTWACLSFVVHVACAFHFTHHWSHTHAFEQTRLESGVGEGLYVNDLFLLLWSLDVAWWWVAPERYAVRSAWVDRSLHGFMLFIAVNATIVFESGAVRWFGLMGLLLLLWKWFRS